MDGVGYSCAKVNGENISAALYLIAFAEVLEVTGMARFVKGLHSFTRTSTRLSTNGLNYACLCLRSRKEG